jgi:hypothetical protein
MDLEEMSCEGLNWPELADFVVHWGSILIMVMERQVRQ